MADFALEASSESKERVVVDEPDPQSSSDTSIEKVEALDGKVATDPASQSTQTTEVFDDAVTAADPASRPSAVTEVADAATGDDPTPQPSNETIRDEAIAIQLRELKYLDLLRVAVIKVAKMVAAVYAFAKYWAFLFRPIINGVEAMVGPVCKSYFGVPFTILRFVDEKIEILVGKVSDLLPSSVKRAGLRVNSELRLVRRIGLFAAAMNHAKKLYVKHETRLKAAWRWAVDNIPLFWRSVRLLLSIVIFLSLKYNRAVRGLVAAAAWIPLVDVDLITRFRDEGRIDRAD